MKIWIALALAAGAARAGDAAPRIYRFSFPDRLELKGLSQALSALDGLELDFDPGELAQLAQNDNDNDGDDDDAPFSSAPPARPAPPAPPAPSRRDREHLRSDRGGAHIFRFGQGGRIEEEDLDGADKPRGVTGQAQGHGSAVLAVKGPVNFRLRGRGGDVEVVAGDDSRVSVSVSGAPAEEIVLLAFGDHVEPRFGSRRQQLRRGKLHVELPKGSQLDLVSMSGDVQVKGIGGEVRIRTMSGDVKLALVSRADVQSISGDVTIEGAAGPVRLRTISGRAILAATGAAPQLDFQSASGNLDWSGACGKDCRLSAETMSGDLSLSVDPQSSFELSYSSHSGELRDEVQLAVKHAPKRKHGMFGGGGWLEATYGKGEGVIEADAFSGSLLLRKK